MLPEKKSKQESNVSLVIFTVLLGTVISFVMLSGFAFVSYLFYDSVAIIAKIESSWRISVSFFVLALLLTLTTSILLYLYARNLELLINNLRLTVQTQAPDTLRKNLFFKELKHFAAELTALIDQVHKKEKLVTELASRQPTVDVADTLAIDVSENLLFTRPFPRLKHFEIALYPRKPGEISRSFATAFESNSFADFLFLKFGQSSLRAEIEKHKHCEKFHTLGQTSADFSTKVSLIWQSLNHLTELLPGFLIVRWNIDGSLLFASAGGFELFFRESISSFQKMKFTESYFSSQIPRMIDMSFSEKIQILIASNEFTDSIELSESYLSRVFQAQPLSNSKSGIQSLLGSVKSDKLGELTAPEGLLAFLNQKQNH